MNALRKWFAGSSRKARRVSRTRLGVEQLESRQMLSASPATVAAGMVGTVTGTASSNPELLARVGSEFFFTADDGIHGRELWVSDGTQTGTSMVKDINPGPAGSDIHYLNTNGHTLFFTANDGTHGEELWTSDGTTANTAMVKDINPGPAGANIHYLTTVNGTLYFTANDGVHGQELWESDGTTSGTFLVKDIRPGSQGANIHYLTTLNGTLYFTANDGVHGQELWKSASGTSGGTFLVKDINPGKAGVNIHYLKRDQRRAVPDRQRRDARSGIVGQQRHHLRHLPGHGHQSRQGQRRHLQAVLHAWRPVLRRQRRCRRPPAVAQRRHRRRHVPARRPHGRQCADDAPHFVARVGGLVYFTANDDVHGRELFRTDGTDAGTFMVKDINPGSDGSNVHYVTQLGNTLYFTADDGTHGQELWRTQGTLATTHLVKDINPGACGSDIVYLTTVGGTIYFKAATTVPMARSCGKPTAPAAAHLLVKDINPGSAGSAIRYLTTVGSTVYFVANDGTDGAELWKTNGTHKRHLTCAGHQPRPRWLEHPLPDADGRRHLLLGERWRPRPGAVPAHGDGTAAGNVPRSRTLQW